MALSGTGSPCHHPRRQLQPSSHNLWGTKRAHTITTPTLTPFKESPNGILATNQAGARDTGHRRGPRLLPLGLSPIPGKPAGKTQQGSPTQHFQPVVGASHHKPGSGGRGRHCTTPQSGQNIWRIRSWPPPPSLPGAEARLPTKQKELVIDPKAGMR